MRIDIQDCNCTEVCNEDCIYCESLGMHEETESIHCPFCQCTICRGERMVASDGVDE